MSDTFRTDGDALVSDRELDDFAAALRFVNAVGALAEERDHHPDILLHGWNKVRLTLATHDAGSTVTDADRALAAAIDEIDA